jgi:hypothetical protein
MTVTWRQALGALVALGLTVYASWLLLGGFFPQIVIEGAPGDYERAYAGVKQVLVAWGIFVLAAVVEILLLRRWWWVALLVGLPGIVGLGLTLPFSGGGLDLSGAFFPTLLTLVMSPLSMLAGFLALIAAFIYCFPAERPREEQVELSEQASLQQSAPVPHRAPGLPGMLRLWDEAGRLANNNPLSPHLAAQLAVYLETAPVIPSAPDGPRDAPAFRTDGIWVWDELIAYYVRTSLIAPWPMTFVEHAQDAGFVPPKFTPEELAVIRGSFGVGLT